MSSPALILFDGVCNLCNGSVRFIIANDPAGAFRFAPLQSDAGRRAIAATGREPATVESIVVIDEAGFHERSGAALRIVRKLRQPWPALALFEAIPARWRDAFYDLIARNRYRWFGQRDSCPLPTAAQRARFL